MNKKQFLGFVLILTALVGIFFANEAEAGSKKGPSPAEQAALFNALFGNNNSNSGS